MTWKPHWCDKAQKSAAEHGLTIGENAEGHLVLIRPAGEVHFVVDLAEATRHAEAADSAAAAAIEAALALAKAGA